MSRQTDEETRPRRRFRRVPAALAVALIGASATAAMSFVGCSPQQGPEPIDSTKASSVKVDSAVDATTSPDGGDAPDATAEVDVPIDARIVDAYKPPVDAYKPPVDAYKPPDAAVDAPHA